MFLANDNFEKLPQSYLFSTVARKLQEYKLAHPDANVIRMDIGDVSLPLPRVVVEALCDASREMGNADTFHGYGPEQGYAFLRDAVAANDYAAHGIHTIGAEDIFISDGAKSDLGNLGGLFGENIKVGSVDPGYPAYVDDNVLDGRGGELSNGKWSGITYLEAMPENDFLPSLPAVPLDVIYLCYPNNPTGAAMTRDQLKQWVDYALANKTLLVFDAAYEAYVSSPEVPRSIYEIPGAERVAIEIRSYSKTAGFTGVRCGYTVVPRSLEFSFPDGTPASLNKMWNRRQCTKFNGVGYIIQKAAAALYTPEGEEAIKENVGYYMRNARMLREALAAKGWHVVGGTDSPYVWFKPNGGLDSWTLFDKLLNEAQLSSTPGVGFGQSADGYLRFTGFNTYENTLEAVKRLNQFTIHHS